MAFSAKSIGSLRSRQARNAQNNMRQTKALQEASEKSRGHGWTNEG